MRPTHYAINLSDACDEQGDGQCDGGIPDGEGNPNASGSECTCVCHDEGTVLPLTIAGVTAWHAAWWANDYATLDVLTEEATSGLDAALASTVDAVAKVGFSTP